MLIVFTHKMQCVSCTAAGVNVPWHSQILGLIATAGWSTKHVTNFNLGTRRQAYHDCFLGRPVAWSWNSGAIGTIILKALTSNKILFRRLLWKNYRTAISVRSCSILPTNGPRLTRYRAPIPSSSWQANHEKSEARDPRDRNWMVEEFF